MAGLLSASGSGCLLGSGLRLLLILCSRPGGGCCSRRWLFGFIRFRSANLLEAGCGEYVFHLPAEFFAGCDYFSGVFVPCPAVPSCVCFYYGADASDKGEGVFVGVFCASEYFRPFHVFVYAACSDLYAAIAFCELRVDAGDVFYLRIHVDAVVAREEECNGVADVQRYLFYKRKGLRAQRLSFSQDSGTYMVAVDAFFWEEVFFYNPVLYPLHGAPVGLEGKFMRYADVKGPGDAEYCCKAGYAV